MFGAECFAITFHKHIYVLEENQRLRGFLVQLLTPLTSCSFLSSRQKCEFNMDNLSKPELLTLLSIMEGELEARDLVIEALRVSGTRRPRPLQRPSKQITHDVKSSTAFW